MATGDHSAFVLVCQAETIGAFDTGSPLMEGRGVSPTSCFDTFIYHACSEFRRPEVSHACGQFYPRREGETKSHRGTSGRSGRPSTSKRKFNNRFLRVLCKATFLFLYMLLVMHP